MAQLKISKGYLKYDSRLLYFGNKVLEPEIMLNNLNILSLYIVLSFFNDIKNYCCPIKLNSSSVHV